MVERGAPPKIKPLHSRLLKSARGLTTPLLPDDYLALMNPLWSTRELTRHDRADPARDRRGLDGRDPADLPVARPRARPVPADRRRDQRPPPLARLLADLRPRPSRRPVSITVKHVPDGQDVAATSRAGSSRARSSTSARSRAPSACPTRCPEQLLFVSAGSGITPIMSMLRELERRDAPRRRRPRPLRARAPTSVIFADLLTGWPSAHPGYMLHEHLTESKDRLGPAATSTSSAPTGASATRFVSGPGELLDAIERSLGGRGRPRPARHGALPAGRSAEATPRSARAAPSASASPTSRRPARPASRSSSAARRPAAMLAVRLPDGDLPHLRRQARRAGRCATCAPARCTASRAR